MKKNGFTDLFPRGERLKILLTMKMFLFFTLALTLSASASIYSQNQRVSLEFSGASVLDIFNEIKEQTGLRFIYNAEKVEELDAINFDVSDMRVDEALEEIFKDTKLECQFYDDVIMVVDRVPELPVKKEGQEKKKLEGTVTDKDGNTLPGVSVVVKGSTIGVATDINGNYTIELEDENAILVFSFVGMLSQELSYIGQAVQNITLITDSEQMEEVVVTGYQTISRERATGAFAVLNAEKLETRITSSVVDKFKGLVPGLEVDKNNKITIRGVSTLYGNSDPLIVLDGFATSITLDELNPDDIENVTVLKDASAASIWGSRAANGVIVITTKKAKKGTGIQVDASYYRTMEMKPDYKDLNLLSSEDAIDLELGLLDKYPNYRNRILSRTYESVKHSALIQAWLRRNSSAVDPSMKYNENQYQNELSRLKSIDGYKQFSDHLLRTSINNQFNVALRSITEKNAFSATVAYNDYSSSSVGTDSDRVAMNIKNNLNLSERLQVDFGVNLLYNESVNNGLDANYMKRHQPFEGIVDENGKEVRNYNKNLMFLDDYESMGLDYTFNAFDFVNGRDNRTKRLSAIANAALHYKINSDITVISKVQYETTSSRSEAYTSVNEPYWKEILNDNFIDGEYKNIPFGGKMQMDNSNSNVWTIRNQLNYKKSFENEKHQISAIVGHEVRKTTSSGNSSLIMGYDKITETGQTYDIEAILNSRAFQRNGWPVFLSNLWPTRYSSDSRDVSYYSNLSYIYEDKYTFTGSYRLDQANLFGFSKTARNNVLWSIGGSWNVTNDLLQDNNWIDRLIVRATYGSNGNRPGGSYTAFLSGKIKDKSHYGPANIRSIELTNAENRDLRSEKVYTTNFGIDYAFMNNRIRGSVEVYDRQSKDLIGPKLTNATNGWERQMINFAEMQNRGVELTLSGTPVKTEFFSWNVDWNISYNKNKVTKTESSLSNIHSYMQPVIDPNWSRGEFVEGKPLGRIYTFNYGGLDANGIPQVKKSNGDIVDYKQTNMGEPNDYISYQGTLKAPWFGALSNTFKYKNFTFGFILNYKFGHKFFAPIDRDGAQSLAFGLPVSKDVLKYWTPENTETDYPALADPSGYTGFSYMNFFQYSDRNLYDAAWVKLSDINCTYNLPKKYIAWSGIKSVILKFQIKNVAKWVANDLDVDPESQAHNNYQHMSFDRKFEQPISFVIGLKANF